MARQYKKILKKIHPKKKKWQEEKPKEKVGKDYLLVAVIAITFFFMTIGWADFTAVKRVLYVALVISLSTTYVRRHYDLTERQDLYAERASYVAMAVAFVAFVMDVYQSFFA